MNHFPIRISSILLLPAVVFFSLFCGCEPSTRQVVSDEEIVEPSPKELAMIPHEGEGLFDREIRQAQERVRQGRFPVAALERLGWAYVSKARASFDTGYYISAEACADAIEAEKPDAEEALLLRGHIFNNLHRFAEAEAMARKLVERRGMASDYLLLGDALMEQGKLDEAIEVYQTGADMKPDLQSYARVGWMRWLIGDLPGAIEATKMAVGASSPLDPESRAWVLTRLANFQFLQGEIEESKAAAEAALQTQSDYPPALLLKGRILMSEGEFVSAVESLERAVEKNPMPDYQWALTEAYRAAGDFEKSARVEADLEKSGATVDGRTYSLYLATKGEAADQALELARKELADRQDIFTHDALAWAFFAAGEIEGAKEHIDIALSEYTDDARLYLHAAAIAAAAGESDEAAEWLDAARDFQHALLPSEREHLKNIGEGIVEKPPESTPVADGFTEKQNKTNL